MVEMTRVLAVDPGGTSGLVYWEGRGAAPGSPETVTPYQVSDSMHGIATARAVELEIAKGLDVLVCESFTINAGTARKTQDGSLQTIETIGMLRWLTDRAGVPFVLQRPGDAINFTSDAKLMQLGWWWKGQEHARSATRHLVLYLASKRLIDLDRLVVK